MNVNRLKELHVVTWKTPSLIIPAVDHNNRNVKINADLMLEYELGARYKDHMHNITFFL